jgi:7-carboxy-7-deazaguanine synthase
MSYSIKEIFYTLQGEGANTGRPAVFCRFTGCNLWSGREQDRATALCRFCDTEFVGTDGSHGGQFATATQLAQAVANVWPACHSARARPFVVCTGGEPLLQMDAAFVDALHQASFEIAVETNGTRPLLPGLDWVCVSPKADAELIVRSGDELKLIFPQAGAEPRLYEHLDFRHFFLQPMDGPHVRQYTQDAVAFCLRHPQWRLSLQTHKFLGIP